MRNKEPIDTAFILAAGFGKRMGSYTRNIPKPLLPVFQFPLMDYTLFQLWRWGIKKIFVNVHYLPSQIFNYFERISYFNIKILEEKKILGTAGALKNLHEYVPPEKNILLINPDRIFFSKSDVAPHKKNNADVLLYGTPRPKNSSEPSWVVFDGVKKNEGYVYMNRNGGDYFYCGLSIVLPKIVSEIKKNTFAELGPLWEKMAKNHRVYLLPWDGHSLDVGDKKSYEAIKEKNVLPLNLLDQWKKFRREVFW